MLVYRVMENYGDYNEVTPYQFGCMIDEPDYVKDRYMRYHDINSFYYRAGCCYRHFFVFVEDAIKYFFTFDNADIFGYTIGEWLLDDFLAVEFSGFGIQYANSGSHPTLEIALPVSSLARKKAEVSSGDDIYLEEVELSRCFMLDGLSTTGNLYDLEFGCFQLSDDVKKHYRQIYDSYCHELYREFIEAYNLTYSKDERKYFGEIISKSMNSDFEKREKILRKYHLIS